MSYWPKDFCPPQSLDLSPLEFSLWKHIEETACKLRPSNTDELKTSVNRVWQLLKKDFTRKVCKSLRPRFERVLLQKVATLNNVMSLGVSISLCYKSCLISLHTSLLYVFTVCKTVRNKTFAEFGNIYSAFELLSPHVYYTTFTERILQFGLFSSRPSSTICRKYTECGVWIVIQIDHQNL